MGLRVRVWGFGFGVWGVGLRGGEGVGRVGVKIEDSGLIGSGLGLRGMFTNFIGPKP